MEIVTIVADDITSYRAETVDERFINYTLESELPAAIEHMYYMYINREKLGMVLREGSFSESEAKDFITEDSEMKTLSEKDKIFIWYGYYSFSLNHVSMSEHEVYLFYRLISRAFRETLYVPRNVDLITNLLDVDIGDVVPDSYYELVRLKGFRMTKSTYDWFIENYPMFEISLAVIPGYLILIE